MTHRPPTLPHHRRGFTFTELLVLVGILLVLVSIFVPYGLKLRESDHRMACMDNLKRIGTSMRDYANANHSAFPCARAQGKHAGYTAFTGPFAADPFAADSEVAANDVSASLWLLVREGYLPSPAVFICPSTADSPDPLTDARGNPTPLPQRGNFRSPFNLSYSYCSTFSSVPDFKLVDWTPWNFAIMADKNPGIGNGSDVTGPSANAPPLEMARANSNNHARAGQNVLYPAGNVSFVRTPYAGIRDDNIYTAQSPTTLPTTGPSIPHDRGVFGRQYGPASLEDSYLVPAEGDGR